MTACGSEITMQWSRKTLPSMQTTRRSSSPSGRPRNTSRRLVGVSRRQFLVRPGGMAAALLAMNVGLGRVFDVSPIEMFEPAAFAHPSVPRDVFIFDDQRHWVYK